MSVLTDWDILNEHQSHFNGERRFLMEPFNREQVNPASYDLLLGRMAYVDDGTAEVVDPYDAPSSHFVPISLDSDGLVVARHMLVLVSTLEVVSLGPGVAASVGGKSSLARIGLVVHQTAGWIDPGYTGNITLELSVVASPVRIYAGMPIAQLVFETVNGTVQRPYQGRYQNSDQVVPSRYDLDRSPLVGTPRG